MLKIGLTGGIGSGKSKVTELFSALGVPVIDADVIAKEITAQQAIIAKISEHFGSKILDASGKINRKLLRDIIFTDLQERKWLEELLHPLILQEMQDQAEQLTACYCLLVAPLLLEATEPHRWVDRVLVVDASEQNQILRTMKRDRMSKEDAMCILASQLSREQRLAMADDVIVNNGDLVELAAEVKILHENYSRNC